MAKQDKDTLYVIAAAYYSADTQGFGLFNCHGVPRKSFHALKAFRSLADTPLRLPLRGDLPTGVAACAGVNGSRTEVTLLLSKFRGPDAKLTLLASNLPWKGPTRYEVFLLDSRRDLGLVQSGRWAAGGRLVQELHTPSVCLVRLRTFPKE